jgi:serine protease Do
MISVRSNSMTTRVHGPRGLAAFERPRLASAIAASALLTALASGTACAPVALAQAGAQAGPPSFRLLVRHVLPAVVNISGTESAAAAAASEDDDAGNPGGAPSNGHDKVFGAGSGFIIDPSGIIVTNDHVVGGASRITVSLSDGTQLPASILGIDQLTDIAVIKVSAGRPLPFVHWGDSRQVEVGDWILVAGNPFGLGGTVTAGIISARGRDIMSGPFDDFLQLDAPINPGNSGGPAFDMSGGVIGVNTAIISPTGGSVGIGFAIPSQIAEGVVTALTTHGHLDRGWLGVAVSDDDARSGVQVTAVEPDGPADRAGLRSGDRILAVNGEPVSSALGLIRAVAEIRPGHLARLMVSRRGRDLSEVVDVGLRPSTEQE